MIDGDWPIFYSYAYIYPPIDLMLLMSAYNCTLKLDVSSQHGYNGIIVRLTVTG